MGSFPILELCLISGIKLKKINKYLVRLNRILFYKLKEKCHLFPMRSIKKIPDIFEITQFFSSNLKVYLQYSFLLQLFFKEKNVTSCNQWQ